MAQAAPAKRVASSLKRTMINLQRGWPAPSLLPHTDILAAATSALSSPAIAVPGLLYGPDAGYEPLRREIAQWMSGFYGGWARVSSASTLTPSSSEPSETSRDQSDDTPVSASAPAPAPAPAAAPASSRATSSPSPAPPITPDRICITGGASQNLAAILQVFSDPVYTRGVWMIEPCYFLAGRVFRDAGLGGRGKMRAVREDREGVDVVALRLALEACEQEERDGMEAQGEPLKPRTAWGKFYRHIIYGVPTFANPSGAVMSLRRREELVRIARQYDALIITDDVYDMLQWRVTGDAARSEEGFSPLTSALLPRIVDIDRTLPRAAQDAVDASRSSSTGNATTFTSSDFGNAISNCSFSKISGPGMRTGWAEGTPRLVHGLSQVGTSRSGGAASQLCATFLAEMLRTGTLQRHVRETLVPAYARRYEVLLRAVQRVLVPLDVRISGAHGDDVEREERAKDSEVAGGFFMWLRLPAGIDADQLGARAEADEGLIVASGTLFAVANGGLSISADGTQGKQEDTAIPDKAAETSRGYLNRYVRLCFAWEDEGHLVEGVERLGRALRGLLKDRALH